MTSTSSGGWVALLVLALAAPAAAQDARGGAVVVVTGEGLVQAVPDRAWITATTESRAGNPREAQRRNAEVMNAVIEKLRSAGLAGDAVRTAGYDLQPEWDMVGNRRVSRGYVARNSIEVRVDSIDRVGELLDLAVTSGATSAGGVRFDLKDRAKLQRDALALAITDARAKADTAATAGGSAVERVVRIEEQGATSRPPVPFVRVESAALAADAPPIEAGQMELRAQVTLTAELK